MPGVLSEKSNFGREKSQASRAFNPRISIICPVFNVQKYITETIKSVLNQSYKNWELIVMDGGSHDRSREIVRKYQDEHPNIVLYSEPDEGSWHATDKGIDQAKGEYLCIIGGQDGFLDREWLSKCIQVFESDRSVSLVWGSSRGMSEDGKLLEDSHVSYSHFLGQETRRDALKYVIQKMFFMTQNLIFGSLERKKILFKKIFSRAAAFRIKFFTERSFPEGEAPRKEEWFKYWLKTGATFNDQGACVSKNVYLECAPRYPLGSKMINHLTDFNFNFNTRGYLSYYLPARATFGRLHPGSSGERKANELYVENEKYLDKILDFKKMVSRNHLEISFIDRHKNPVSKIKF